MFKRLKEAYVRYGVRSLLKSEEGTLKDFAYLIGGFIITVLVIGAGYAAIAVWTPEFLDSIKGRLDNIFNFTAF